MMLRCLLNSFLWGIGHSDTVCDVSDLTVKNQTYADFSDLTMKASTDEALKSILTVTWYNAALSTLALLIPVIVLVASFFTSKSLKSILTSDSESEDEQKDKEIVQKDRIVYGEHDASHLPDTPIDVINQCLDEAREIAQNPQVTEKLNMISRLSNGIDKYCEQGSAPMSKLMKEICQKTQETDWDSLYDQGELQFKMVVGCLSGHLEGVFLKQLASIMKAKSALEIGTFTGSAALAMAEGMEAEKGEVVTIEIDPYLKKFCDPFFNSYNKLVGRRALDMRIGDAIEVMKDLAKSERKFDLIFVDANKSEYATYVDILLEYGLVENGSLIVVDNVHFKGTAWCNNGISDHMKTSRFVRAFNEKIAQDARLSPVMLPIRDGVTLIEVSGLDEKTNLQKVEQLVGELVKLDITPKLANKTAITEGAVQILELPQVRDLMLELINWEEFDTETGNDAIDVLACVKVLRYFLNLPLGYVTSNLNRLVQAFGHNNEQWNALNEAVMEDIASVNIKALIRFNPSLKAIYGDIAKKMQIKNPHLVFPTSIYQTSGGHTFSSADSSKIEAFLSTVKTSSIRIMNQVLNIESTYLRDLYKPLTRCVCVIDQTVDGHWGTKLDAYFSYHGIELVKLVYRAHEADKNIGSVQKILQDYKKNRAKRNEPVLVVGGGVITDLAGFACGLYHRGTPYIMLCTSVVSGIDAGPSPRTCCDGDGYKNLFGTFNPPVVTITDRSFFSTLRKGWLRHGLAEIIKMGVVKDRVLFECMEKGGYRLIETMFGNSPDCQDDTEFQALCDLIISRALDSYVQSEYGNLWECHQCRPHAYGHIWSPGFELPAGMLHGHAIAIGMGFGAYLSFQLGWIPEGEFRRVLNLFSTLELSLVHPILENTEAIWQAQVRMIEKHGGNLAAPLPKEQIGSCGYFNDITREELEKYLAQYRSICETYPRRGLGVEAHCTDVGLEDPREL